MAKQVSFDEVKDQIGDQGDFGYTIQWYYDQGKVTQEDDGQYACDCLVCRQHHKNPDPALIVTQVEGCRTMHVHDKGVTF